MVFTQRLVGKWEKPGETRRNQEGKEEGIRIEQGKKLPRMWFQIKLS